MPVRASFLGQCMPNNDLNDPRWSSEAKGEANLQFSVLHFAQNAKLFMLV